MLGGCGAEDHFHIFSEPFPNDVLHRFKDKENI